MDLGNGDGKDGKTVVSGCREGIVRVKEGVNRVK